MIKYSSKPKNQNLPSKTQIQSHTYTTIKIHTYLQFKKSHLIHHIILTTLYQKHFLPDILRENQRNQTLFSIKTISMVNCSSKNKIVLFFSQHEFNPNT